MNYPVRVTSCISLIKNLKQYAHAHMYKVRDEVYMEVETLTEARLIAQINSHQELTFTWYNKLAELNSNS